MPPRPWLRRLVLGLGMIPAWGAVAPAVAKEPGSPPIYHKHLQFRIPFDVTDEIRPRLKSVELVMSIDQGYHWKVWAATSPDKPSFLFKAPRDGEYWFAIRSIDTKDRSFPPEDQVVEPRLKVIVDTTPPTIDLAPMSRRGSKAAVRWEVNDENLDLKSLVVEYQAPGREWRAVPRLRQSALNSAEWDAGTADAIRVRASVADRAGNRQTVAIDLPEGIGAAPGSMANDPRDFSSPPPVTPIAPASISSEADPFPPSPSPSTAPIEPPPRVPPRDDPAPRPSPSPPAGGGRSQWMSSPIFRLQYAVDDAGPSGPARVQLWVTRNNGKTWNFLPEDADKTSPYEVNLGGEGTFGLSLCVESANGLGDPPPAPGDPPQMWVVVDRTPPLIQLDPVRVGSGAQAGRVTLTWRSSDDHPGTRPVVVSYKPDRPGARWQAISTRIDDTGRFDWTVPASAPDRFFLRIDIDDALDNHAFAETPTPVVLDRTRPKARILGLDGPSKPKY